ncbi:hypothetical protein V2J09_011595 [Rumex salicifolius]
MVLTGDCPADRSVTKASLDKVFTVKDLGPARYFLGIKISRSPQGIHLNQRKYIVDLLTDVGLLVTLHPFQGNRRLVGRLLYLTLSRPDISYTVQQLSQFIQSPSQPHFQAALFILRYRKGVVNGMYHASSDLSVKAYYDACWTGRLSQTQYEAQHDSLGHIGGHAHGGRRIDGEAVSSTFLL